MASIILTPNMHPVKGWLRVVGFTLLWIDVVLMVVALVKAFLF
jgi:hypothetical protein